MNGPAGEGAENGAGRPLRVLLVGNPNCGKTTLFNALTGSRQHVGNYPGVTVETREGGFVHNGRRVTLVDLPGVYGLTPHSEDERVARDALLDNSPNCVLNVVDASNLERNLYLTVQLRELETPVVVALNLWDVVEKSGEAFDTARLGRLMGCTMVPVSARKRSGLDALRDALFAAVAEVETGRVPAAVPYSREIEAEIGCLLPALNGLDAERFAARPPRWTAVKLLEADADAVAAVRAAGSRGEEVAALAESARERLRRHFGETPAVVVAESRYGFISGACTEVARQTAEKRHAASDRVDEVLVSRVFGIPVFLGVMYLVFRLSFTLGEWPGQWIEALFAWTGDALVRTWPWGPDSAALSLLVNGILAGVGGVLVFAPTIMIIFLAIALLEDSGYMARAAFLMDTFMHRVGLHGKSFVPMLIGFGCTVPAVLATRMLESRRDRLTTILVLPLFSCGARLPIYTLFIGALFPPVWRTPMMMTLYLIGVATALLLARMLRHTLFRGETEPLVMDLPPYRAPTLAGLLQHTWERGWLFLRKAGTVIVVISCALWMLSSYPRPPAEDLAGKAPAEQAQARLAHSWAGRAGRAIEPVMRHVGFDWKASTALLGAFAAKEVFVSQLSIVNALAEGEEGSSRALSETLRRDYTPLQAFCIMLFCLISVPCVMTLAATARETGSWLWSAAQLAGLTVLAYAMTWGVYQGGLWIGRWT